MKIGMNPKSPETNNQLVDFEYWEELERSGHRSISYHEFADRPSTKINREILQSINSALFNDENRASIRSGQKENGSTQSVINSSLPSYFKIELGHWRHANGQDRDSLGNTYLHRAITKGVPPVVIEFLINKGIDVNSLNKAGETALFIAASDGKTNLVKALLKMGASPKLRNSKGISPVKAASTKGHITTVNELMGSGAKTKARRSKKKRNTGRRPQPREKRYRWEQDWLSEVTEGDLR